MNSDDANYQDIQKIFLSVVELKSSDERNAYLDKACGEDAKLRKSLEVLMKAYEEGCGEADLLKEPGLGAATNSWRKRPKPKPESPRFPLNSDRKTPFFAEPGQ